MLQNERGNSKYVTLPNTCTVLAMKEYNEIIYFVLNDADGALQIGTFPSVGDDNTLVNRYSPIKTLENGDFIANAIKINEVYKLELQPSYDGSINLIIANDKYQPLLINSGFRVEGSLVERNDINYNIPTLLQEIQLIKTINTISTVDFIGTEYGGDLLAGNYKFFFRYSDIDGNESDIFAETQNINIVFGNITKGVNTIRGGLLNENTGKILRLKLNNLDTSYKYVNVYYSRTTGEKTVITEYKKIDKKYPISSSVKLNINGMEDLIDYTEYQMFKDNVNFDGAKAMAQVNNNLFIANIGKSTDYNNIKPIIEEITANQEYDKDGIGWYDTTENEQVYEIVDVTTSDVFDTIKADIATGSTRGKWYKVSKSEPLTVSFDSCIKGIFEGVLDLGGNTFNITITSNEENVSLFEYIKAPAKVTNGFMNITLSGVATTGQYSYKAGIASVVKQAVGSVDITDLSVSVTASNENGVLLSLTSALIASVEKEASLTIKNCKVKFDCTINRTGGSMHVAPLCSEILGSVICEKSIMLTTFSGSAKDTFDNYYALGFSALFDSNYTGSFSISDSLIDGIANRLTNSSGGGFNKLRVYAEPINTVFNNTKVYIRPLNDIPLLGDSHSGYFLYYENPILAISTNPYNQTVFNTLNLTESKGGAFTVNNETNSFDTVIFTPKETVNESKLTSGAEYYSEANMYYKLGYMPNEFYKFGIVCILDGGQVTPVMNISNGGIIKIDNGDNLFDKDKNIYPIGIRFNITQDIRSRLKKYGVIGVIPVRQKRIPNFMCNGIILNTTQNGVPTVKVSTNEEITGWTNKWLYESLFNKVTEVSSTSYKFSLSINNAKRFFNEVDKSNISENAIMISPDVMLNSEFYSTVFSNGDFIISQPQLKYDSTESKDNILYTPYIYDELPEYTNEGSRSIKYINEYCTSRRLNGVTHRAVFGNETDIQSVPIMKYQYDTETFKCKSNYSTIKYVRGLMCPHIAISKIDSNNGITRSIYLSDPYSSTIPEVLIDNKSPYYTIGDRFDIRTETDMPLIFGGDCFIGDFCSRVTRNFIDTETPNQDVLIKAEFETSECKPMGEGDMNLGDFRKDDASVYNRADINAVQLGYWVKFKAISNINLIHRSIDASDVMESNLKSEKGFFPYKEISYKPEYNVQDSYLVNKAYSMTSTTRPYFDISGLRSINDYFPTRVLYSNADIKSLYTNNFRIFDELSRVDYPMEYGEVTNLEAIGNNLLVVFKNGVGVAPVNERVLTGTGDGGDVYVTSQSVITDNIVMLSDYVGAIDSTNIVKSKFAIYGIDIIKKKIWRTDGTKIEILSDFKIQSFLNKTYISKAYMHYDKFKNTVYIVLNNSINISYSEITGEFMSFNSWVSTKSVNAHNCFNTINDNYLWKHSMNSDYCKFYNVQYPFEFEFVVNAENPNTQKIFDNIKIISNKCEPYELDITTSGDLYDQKEESVMSKQLYSISKVGRLKGNMQYKENVVDIMLPSMDYNGKKSKIRDKYIKIKLKYTGKDHAVIRSIITLYNISYG